MNPSCYSFFKKYTSIYKN